MAQDFISDRQLAARYKRAEAGNPVAGKSPDEAEAYIENQVNDLASAKVALKKMARTLALHDAYIKQLIKLLK